MATHFSTLAWKIPWTEEPGRLQSTGLQSWTRLSDFTFTTLCRHVLGPKDTGKKSEGMNSAERVNMYVCKI